MPAVRLGPFGRLLLRLSVLVLACLAASPRARAQESVYHGVFVTSNLDAGLGPVHAFENAAGKPVSIIHVFQAIDGGGNVFPASRLQSIRDHGAIPLLTLEPWFDLRDIVAGKHDGVLTSWALAAKAWGHPFFFRYAHEMNSDWYPRWSVWPGNGNTAEDYVAAWRHVHGLFTEVGVTNATWVWCVNRFFDLPAGPSTRIAALYPGDRYVDWISFDAYNRGTVGGGTWRSFADASQPVYDELLRIAPGKPVMVAETGTVEPGGDKADWFRTALKNHLKTRFPRIKAWVYFDLDKGGYDNRITSGEASRAAYAESVGLSYFSANRYASLATSPIPPLLADALASDTQPPFVRIARPHSPRVPAGQSVELRAEADDAGGIARVEFFIDDVLALTATSAPYLHVWKSPAANGVTSTIRIVAHDTAGNSAAALDVLTTTVPATTASVYWGAAITDAPRLDFQSVHVFETAAGKSVSLLALYSAWQGRPPFPSAALTAVRNHGAIPVLTWEPRDPTGGAAQPAYTLRSIAEGAHDSYLAEWAGAAAAWGQPFFLRFAPQMNGDWFPWAANANGNTAADFVAAWRHVRRVFLGQGAHNVTWVWAVNRLHGGASEQIADLYPGDRQVDWVAVDGFNRGGAAWRDFETTFGRTLQALVALAPAKPVMISESGSVETGGNKAAWFREAFQTRLLQTYPRVRAVVYCETARDGFANSIATSPAARAAFAESVGAPYYAGNTFATLAESPIPPLLADALPDDAQAPFLRFALPLDATLTAGATHELRVEYADRSALDRIEFRIDGVLRQTERLAPYQFFWPVPSAPGVGYTLTATAWDAAGNSSATIHQIVSVAPIHAVDAWRGEHFAPAQIADPGVSGDAADPDGDWLPNLLEYALGGDPLAPSFSATPQADIVASRLRITFFRARSGVRYEVQASADLLTWTSIATNPGQIDQHVTVSDTVSTGSHPRRFLRLRVTRD